jgi:hypothetical protein
VRLLRAIKSILADGWQKEEKLSSITEESEFFPNSGILEESPAVEDFRLVKSLLPAL